MKVRCPKLLIAVLAGFVLCIAAVSGGAYVLHKTNQTEFCISCHTMTLAYEEYQGSVHFMNAKGIRAECADCHIPNDNVWSYLKTKIGASKDVYHHFVTGKIDTEELYEENRLAMAEAVWEQMRENDSAACRSCHEYDAMDSFGQSENAASMHAFAIENKSTCIDCHKGIAHFPPELEMSSESFDNLMSHTTLSPSTETAVTVDYLATDIATVRPAVRVNVLKVDNSSVTISLDGYQLKGAESLLFNAFGQRSVLADIHQPENVEVGSFKADEYGNEWRTASIQINTEDANYLESISPIWEYASELDHVYCGTCHAVIPGSHFTTNAWGPIAKGMGDRTDISEHDLEILTKYLQAHARDAQ